MERWLEKISSKNSWVLVFLFCAAFLAYGNILFGGFIFDDNTFIEHNEQIRSPANIGEIYSSSTTAGSGISGDNFYRPNQQFVYTILYFFFGLSPFFFHLNSVLFHILNACLLFLLAGSLGISRKVALLGALIFLLHPIQTEAVSYISGLSDLLVSATILLTALLFIKSTAAESQKKYLLYLALGALVFSLGLFSKENEVVAAALVLLLAIFLYKNNKLPNLFRAFVFIGILGIIAGLYLYARINLLNFTGTLGLTG